MKYSYKRADFVANHRYQEQNITKFFKASLLLLRLVSPDKNVIFVDEFKINLINTKFMKWCKAGTKGVESLSMKTSAWYSMSHSAALDSCSYKVHMTVNSGYFFNFKVKLFRILFNEFLETRCQICVIFDNASIHVCKAWRRLYESK